MIISFLQSERPLHYLLAGAIMLCGCALSAWVMGYGFTDFIIVTAIGLFTVLFGVYISIRGQFAGKSVYPGIMIIFLYLSVLHVQRDVTALALLPVALLFFYRMFGMDTGRGSESHLFDVSFFAAIAALADPYLFILFIVVYVAIIVFYKRQPRYFLIPPIAIATVALLTFTVIYVFGINLGRINLPGWREYLSQWDVARSLGLTGYCIIAVGLVYMADYILRWIDINRRLTSVVTVTLCYVVVIMLYTFVAKITAYGIVLLIFPIALYLGRAMYQTENKYLLLLIAGVPALLYLTTLADILV